MGGVLEPDKVKAWATASLAWAKRQWAGQLASVVLHLDEMTPHLHLLVVPRVKSAAGIWKLNSKALFDRERLRELQTSYGEAMAPLGIQRGEPGSQAVHSEVRQFYGAVNASNGLPERVKLPPAPKAPAAPSGAAASAAEAFGSVFGMETAHQRSIQAHAQAMKKWQETCKELRQQDAAAWEQLKARSTMAPLVRKQRQPAATQQRPESPQPAPKGVARAQPRR